MCAVCRTIWEKHEEWKHHRWQKFSTKALMDETQQQLVTLQQLPDEVQQWDIYLGLWDDVSTIQVHGILYPLLCLMCLS